MKITKYVHSCLLVETSDRVGIIDPGQFSWESGLFDVNSLERLDDIVITHEHADHMYLPFIQALLAKFSDARITTTRAGAALLEKEGIKAQAGSSEGVELFATDHESTTPLGTAPENTGVHYLGQLTHPGDSHHFTETKDILALPVNAPWGTIMRAAALGTELKPRFIIPIHDWHWNDTARSQFYDRLEAFFKDQGIVFVKSVDGVAIEPGV